MRRNNYNALEPFSAARSLSKTGATGLILTGIVSFVAMFFLLQARKGEAGDMVAYFLPWCIGYGIPDLAMAGLGVWWLTHEMKNPFELQVFAIICMVGGVVGLGLSFPYIILWGNVEFFVSMIVISLLEIGLGILTLRAYLKRE